MIAEFQLYITDLIKNKKKGFLASLCQRCLQLLSWPYQAIIFLRNKAYDLGLFRSKKLQNCVVISVGNITVGGTGKTPFTLMLARSFVPFAKVAVLSRGYRSQNRASTILSKGDGPIFSAQECGDEPYLLAKNLPNALVVVGQDRCLSAKLAQEQGAQLLILDDGMQHRRLSRNMDVVMVNAAAPFESGHFLPRGLLRDAPQSLRRANLIIGNGISSMEQYQKLQHQLKKYSRAPLVGIEMKFFSSQPIAGKRVAVFSGIAFPERFRAMVEEAGAVIIEERSFPDHFNYKSDSLDKWVAECIEKDVELLVCTEKDWVKLIVFPKTQLPIVWTTTIPEITIGQEHWKNFIVHSKALLAGNSK